jgi:threonine dehydrogenase-like Zn-dependent dehydrogenase
MSSPSDDHAVGAIRDLTGGHGADVQLDCVGAEATIELARTAFRSGDQATLACLIDEHVIWHVPGPYQMAADIRGRNAILNIEAWLDRLRTKVSWLVEDHVFGRYDRVRSGRHGRARASMRKHES